jgi:hypothetical protein
MGHHAERTPVLLAALQKEFARKFTASELKEQTGVPKKFVRRALTVDDEREARVPMRGVEMWRGKKDRLWRFRAVPPSRSGGHISAHDDGGRSPLR